jgi:multidrug efflux pump subunit AcrB
MNFRNISAWSIRNPVPPIVLFLALMLAGVVSFMRMDVNRDPDIDFPIAIVVVNQPGAAPTEMETQVTQRVEAAVRSLQGIDEINSTVTEGNSETVIQLTIGTPIDRAVNDVRDAIAQIRSDLPDGILEPQVYRANTSGNDVASFAAITTDMTVEQLSWYIDDTVTKELLSIPGMATISRNGGVSREIRVILDPLKLQSQGLTASQVNLQLRQVNLNAAGGRAEIAGSEQSIRVLGNARNASDLGQTQINVGNGRTVRLADIAQVRDLYAEQRSRATVDGRQAITFDFQRAKGASDVTVYHQAVDKLRALEKRNPSVKFVQRYTTTEYTEAQYESAIHAMIEGAILAVIVVFIFLRDWRATAISALAIPLSAIPAFWFMDLLGFDLNGMTLLALSLVAGVLVDDAIVEIENIVRHMRMGKSAYQASIDAADEIGLAVAGDDDGDRRGVHAGRADAGYRRPVLQELRPDGGRGRADEPRGRASRDADDRGVFPQVVRPCQPRRGQDHGLVCPHAPLDARQPQGRGMARARRHPEDVQPRNGSPDVGDRRGRGRLRADVVHVHRHPLAVPADPRRG